MACAANKRLIKYIFHTLHRDTPCVLFDVSSTEFWPQNPSSVTEVLVKHSKVSSWRSMCSHAVLCFLCYINRSRSFVLNCQARQLWYVPYVSNIFQINVFHLIWAFLWMSHSTLLLCVVCVWFLCRSLTQLCPHVTQTVALLANLYTWWFASKTPKFSCFSFFLFLRVT